MKMQAMEGGQPAVLPRNSAVKKADFGSVEFLEQVEDRRAVKVCKHYTMCDVLTPTLLHTVHVMPHSVAARFAINKQKVIQFCGPHDGKGTPWVSKGCQSNPSDHYVVQTAS